MSKAEGEQVENPYVSLAKGMLKRPVTAEMIKSLGGKIVAGATIKDIYDAFHNASQVRVRRKGEIQTAVEGLLEVVVFDMTNPSKTSGHPPKTS